MTVTDLVLDATSNKVRVLGISTKKMLATLKYGNDSFTTTMSWQQLKDELYAYDGELGARVSQAGSVVDMTLSGLQVQTVVALLFFMIRMIRV